ncbi:hypothetical protein [Victivallis sp. Marseille-Q1083]|uniref:hypothetical protein n=1 Tax=Victivallis sp. Marseille-Q1083 TaxID=2717288 RepID=UPI00158A2ACF|nr:hypothetical protein [Victivallis sp. Marseille-Q1083]
MILRKGKKRAFIARGNATDVTLEVLDLVGVGMVTAVVVDKAGVPQYNDPYSTNPDKAFDQIARNQMLP